VPSHRLFIAYQKIYYNITEQTTSHKRHRMKPFRLMTYGCLSVVLAACAIQDTHVQISPTIPPQWYAPLPLPEQRNEPIQNTDNEVHLPHQGNLTDLSQWWRNQGDLLLAELIDAAQTASPTIASAKSHIEQARSTRVAASAALLPALDTSLNASRSSLQSSLPMGTGITGIFQSTWEIDLFGTNGATRDAAQARLEAAQAGWHDARVSVAAEVANQYYNIRTCKQLLDITLSDATSRAETARLSDLSANAGFQTPAFAALARASAAEGNSRAIGQHAQCDLGIKALVALTAMPEPELRQKMAVAPFAFLPAQTAAMSISALPAQILAQRPDVYSAEHEVAAASAEIGNARAHRYPRLALSGSVGVASFRSGGITTNLGTWSVGPATLTLPLFDGGKISANIDAAQSRYAAAVTAYEGNVRQAVREVEEALVNLDSTGKRNKDALITVEGYRTAFNGTEARYQSGLASLVELEDTRRTRLAAEIALVSLQRERMAAWVALYRAAGGGWNNNLPNNALPAQP
jgi:outer membrane protein, multidrug efflux system